jgi:hypothetical protein
VQPALAADQVDCQAQSLVGTLSPPIPSASQKLGVTEPVTGSYSAQGFGVCVKIDNDAGDSASNSIVFTTYVAAMQGTYTAVAGCGSVTLGSPFLSGLYVLDYPGDARFEGPYRGALQVKIAGGTGVMQITEASNGERAGGHGAGVVTFIPAGGNCIATDVPGFAMAAAFTITV